MPGPGACWSPDPSVRTGPPASGWPVKQPGARCRHAKSARLGELRLAVYTVLQAAFSTVTWPSTGRRLGLVRRDGPRWAGAMRSLAAMVAIAVVCAGSREGRSGAAGLAAAPTARGDPAVRRPITELEPRSPRRRPGGSAWAAGVRGRAGHCRVRREVGRSPAGVRRPPGGLRTSYEPVRPSVRAGQLVAAGAAIGELAAGHSGCVAPACLHWGAMWGPAARAEYVDPLGLLATTPIRLKPLLG